LMKIHSRISKILGLGLGMLNAIFWIVMLFGFGG
jgi:hypothetical protein